MRIGALQSVDVQAVGPTTSVGWSGSSLHSVLPDAFGCFAAVCAVEEQIIGTVVGPPAPDAIAAL